MHRIWTRRAPGSVARWPVLVLIALEIGLAAVSQSLLRVAMIHPLWMAIRHLMKARHSRDRSLIIVQSRLLPPRKFLLPSQVWITARSRMRRINFLREQVLHRPFAITPWFRLTAHRQQWNTDRLIEARHQRPVSHRPVLLRRNSPKQVSATADTLMPTTPRIVPISNPRMVTRARARGGVLRAREIPV